MADRTPLEQIINNLQTNALKYTAAGGIVRMRVYAGQNEAVLAVQDTGIGISAELMPRLFDIFIQEAVSLDRSASRSHSGLLCPPLCAHGRLLPDLQQALAAI
jgi:signal transduction histidine kinase